MLKKLYPVPKYFDERKEKDYQFFLVIFCVALVAQLWYIYSVNYIFKTDVYNKVLFPTLLINVISFSIYKKSKYFEFTKILISFSSLSFIFTLLTAAGGIKSPGYSWVIMVPLLLGTLFKKKGTLIGMGLIIIYSILMIQFKDSDFVGYISMSQEDFIKAQIENALTFPIAAFTIIYFYLGMIEKSENELNNKRDEIDTLLKIVIHDIANPLQVAKIRIKRELRNNQSKNITETKMAMEIISSIIKQAREIRSAKDGKLVTENRMTKVSELFDQVEPLFKSRLDEKQLLLQVESYIDPAFEYPIDPSIFKNQILNNLISNAIKFSYKGSVIFVRTLVVGDYWTLEVRDHGSGIPNDKIKSLFNAHEKTSTAGTAGEKGTGFGLPILKAFVEVYNGQIDVFSVTKEDNPVHHGTTIRISFPLDQEMVNPDTKLLKDSA